MGYLNNEQQLTVDKNGITVNSGYLSLSGSILTSITIDSLKNISTTIDNKISSAFSNFLITDQVYTAQTNGSQYIGNFTFGGQSKGQYISMNNGSMSFTGLPAASNAINVNSGVSNFQAITATIVNSIGTTIFSYLNSITSNVQTQLNNNLIILQKKSLSQSTNGSNSLYSYSISYNSNGTAIIQYGFIPKSTHSTVTLFFDVMYSINGGSGYDQYSSNITISSPTLSSIILARKVLTLNDNTMTARNSSTALFPISCCYKNTDLTAKNFTVLVYLDNANDNVILQDLWMITMEETQN
jgi:hypothetical protein